MPENRNITPLPNTAQLYQAAFEQSALGMALITPDGKWMEVNHSFCRITGYTRQELTAQHIREILYEPDTASDQERINALRDGRLENIRLEKWLIHKEGRFVWMLFSVAAVRDVHGRVLYFVVQAEDIDAQKRIEKALLSEKQRFSDMFHSAPVTMCILKGEDLVFESANELYYQFSGRRDIIGKSVKSVFPEAEGQGIFELMEKVLRTGEIYSVNERLVQLDVKGAGQVEDFYLSFMFQPYRNVEGLVEGIFYFGVDVTEQVHARKKIEESRKQYIELIQNLPAAVYTCDAQGYIQLYNKAAAALWGREPELGKDQWNGALKLYEANGNPLPHEAIPLAQSLKEERPMRGREYQLQRPDGSMRHVASFPTPVFDSEGRLTGGVNVLIDVTDRKRTEEELARLSLIAQKTVNAVLLTDPEARIEWVNEAFTRITGYRLDEVIGKTPVFLHGPKTDPGTVAYMIEKRKRQEPFACELLKYTKSGQPFWVEKEAQPLFDAHGKLTRYFEIETDITERKRVYDQLVRKENEVRSFARQLNDKLEEERSRIAREIHDEFGQQLTGLKMSLSSLLNMDVSEEHARAIVSEMMADIERSIRSLRSFATELRPSILDTLGLIPSLKWLVQEFEKKTGINCEASFRVERQVFSPDISIAFFRICQEALTNISKHALATAVAVEVVQMGGNLSMAIADNGNGIQDDKLEDPLSMGLIGMRERALLIGGNLKITTTNNQGTTVHLSVKFDE